MALLRFWSLAPGATTWSNVGRDALLHIGLEQVHGWMPHPLGQASQCLPLLASQEQQKGGRAEDFSDGGLSRSRQVVRQWGYGRGVGCLCCRGVKKSLCYPQAER